jgi:hypothetical protein
MRPGPILALLGQSVELLLVTSIYFGLLGLLDTKVPCAFSCSKTGVPFAAGVASGTTVFSGMPEHCGVGVGLVRFPPLGVGVGVGVGVGAGPEHIATLTSDKGA